MKQSVATAIASLALAGCAQVGRSVPEAEMMAKGDYLTVAACVNDSLARMNPAIVHYAEFSARRMARISVIFSDSGVSAPLAIFEFREASKGVTRISGDGAPAWIAEIRSRVTACEGAQPD